MKDYQKKHNLATAVSLGVGAVIGSGVFFKAETVSHITDGNLAAGVTAWALGGAVMLLCLLAFSHIAGKGGGTDLLEMAEKTVGDRFSYYTGWFTATVYYPSLTAVLSYLSSHYLLMFFGIEDYSEKSIFLFSVIFLVWGFGQNLLFPEFFGKFQVATTVAKLIPLTLMTVFGITAGLSSGRLSMSVQAGATPFSANLFFPAVVSTLFAYEGWIATVSMGQDIKNSKRNLPLALIIGGSVISAVYISYYIGIIGAVGSETLIYNGKEGVNIAYRTLFGKYGAKALNLFVSISCIGAQNALAMGCARATGHLFPDGKKKRVPFVAGAVTGFLWILFMINSQSGILSKFYFDSSELPVVTVYALYIPIFLMFARREKTLKGTILCAGGIISSAFAVVCGVISHRDNIISYAMILASIMLLGTLFQRKSRM